MNKLLQREEALKRLEILKEKGLVYKPAIKCFKDGEDIGMFENQGGPFKATFYKLFLNTGDDGMYDQISSAVKKFEAEHDACVYLILINHLEFGTCASLFYVSKYEEEWEEERQDLQNNETYAYVANLDDDFCSESGYIGFTADPMMGGLYRSY